MYTLIGVPLQKRVMPLTCQPPRTYFKKPLERSSGNEYT